MQFDFLLDKNSNLYLIEVNMSPNLYAGVGVEENVHLYDDVVGNLIKVLGYGSTSAIPTDRDLGVNSDACLSKTCKQSCDSSECQFCIHCMSLQQKYDLKKAYFEQLNTGEMRRVLPPSNVKSKKLFS